MRGRTIQILAAACCALLLLLGLCRGLLSPESEILYENRPAKRMPAFSPADFLRGDFQAEAEDALADQLPAAIKQKKLYNIFDAGAALPVIRALGRDGGYIGFRDVCFYGDMLVVRPVALADRAEALGQAAALINAWAGQNPGVEFYVYYIETDKDIDFDSGEKSGLFSSLSAALALPEGHTARLKLESFDDYRRLFLKTDHHWNADGARDAYLALCGMLGCEPLPCRGQHTVAGRYRGTRAAGVEGVPAEDFSISLYDWPEMRYETVGGQIADYGMQEAFAADALESFSYGSVYGGDLGELVVRAESGDRTLLVLGDSYDNALVKTLSAGFRECRFVDLRAYEAETGQAFDMARYLAEHRIDAVLLIGGVDYFSGTLIAQGGS